MCAFFLFLRKDVVPKAETMVELVHFVLRETRRLPVGRWEGSHEEHAGSYNLYEIFIVDFACWNSPVWCASSVVLTARTFLVFFSQSNKSGEDAGSNWAVCTETKHRVHAQQEPVLHGVFPVHEKTPNVQRSICASATRAGLGKFCFVDMKSITASEENLERWNHRSSQTPRRYTKATELPGNTTDTFSFIVVFGWGRFSHDQCSAGGKVPLQRGISHEKDAQVTVYLL